MEDCFYWKKNNNTIIDQVIQTNIEDSYCLKLYYLSKANYWINKPNSYPFFNILIQSKNYIY